MERYFLITCHRGHCGKGNSTLITFAFEAKNLIDAMDMGKKMPSVKHTKMIISGKEITIEEYKEFRKINAYDKAYQVGYKMRRRMKQNG